MSIGNNDSFSTITTESGNNRTIFKNYHFRLRRTKRVSSVAREKVLILAKQAYLDGQSDLNGYQKRLRSLGFRYMKVFDN
jgi:hypothetical protein